ncbi:MAG: dihydropteroate synthase [Candidatus Omnitrophota bacterium]
MLDVCTVLTERTTEKEDSAIIIKRLAESVNIPLMIDSTDSEVIETALQVYPGTAFINSVNLEDKGVKARKIFNLAREHGSYVVNLLIDAKGMAKTVKHKVKAAEDLYEIAVKECGLKGERLIFDMLTFTLASGDKEYSDSGGNTFKAIKGFKKRHPEVLTVLGVSNVSFGLTKEARRVLNMVFLHNAVKFGLDMAIVNPSDFIEYKDIGKQERVLSEDLIYNRKRDAIERFLRFFADRKTRETQVTSFFEEEQLDIGQKIKKCIYDRDKKNIISLLDEAMKELMPEHILNNILMDAMKKIGDKLDKGEVVLPFVLQSAEVMKKAMEYLEEFLPKDLTDKKGKVLIATVFGDVHDIGKNLVKMILQNNGFTVIDLGKQVPVEKIVEEAKRHKPDAIGLSALLVSTARHMKTCVQSMHEAGLDYPILIGGAPTNTRFAGDIAVLDDSSIYKGGVFYAKDVFAGVKIMRLLMDSAKRENALSEYTRRIEEKENKISKVNILSRSAKRRGVPAFTVQDPPFFGTRSLYNISADDVFGFLNEEVLFSLAWGANLRNKEQKERLLKEDYKPLLKQIKEDSIRKGWLDFKAVYGYFRVHIVGQNMEVLDGTETVLEKFSFDRLENGTSIIDHFREKQGERELVAFQAVTVGDKINDAIKKLNDAREFSRAFLLHGFSVHLAEALAVYMHTRIRDELNLGKNRGKRYSPGYPLWKSLEDQVKIFKLLAVEDTINIKLTEGYQMIPEQSTTAMVVVRD